MGTHPGLMRSRLCPHPSRCRSTFPGWRVRAQADLSFATSWLSFFCRSWSAPTDRHRSVGLKQKATIVGYGRHSRRLSAWVCLRVSERNWPVVDVSERRLRPGAVCRSQKIEWPVCELNRPLGPDQNRFPMRRLRETPGWAPGGRFSMAARQFPVSTAFSAAATV